MRSTYLLPLLLLGATHSVDQNCLVPTLGMVWTLTVTFYPLYVTVINILKHTDYGI